MPVATIVAPGEVRDFAQAVEDIGYDYIVAWDHVLGADVSRHTPWDGPDTLVPIHEPLVLCGFLAAWTRRVGLAAVIGLPQRQTALVGKQAAEVDVLTGGRLRLGVALGWVAPEFQALNAEFSSRARRVEEQIRLLRALWTHAVVDFAGDWHRIDHMGVSPLPVQRPIPIWIGGHAEASLRRVAAMGDGWMAAAPPDVVRDEGLSVRLRDCLEAGGRPPGEVGIDGIVNLGVDLHDSPGAELRSPDVWRRDTRLWRDLGATHLTINTSGAGLRSATEHIEALRRFRQTLT
jgi:probable F420-dependent oxidoreductase